ncbi:cation:proton antiporter [Belliella pelovolcani]|uniref:Transporter, CPA2 family n=1 Tax=Belliella pelovolcani TaxID=529505 RepID=A0A1N7MQ92_9BACT|nr:cation:proton antiporter [Belliella pelovolcani]SIS88101.1 transporter, CPA2 family [Belliella pelovolcani]
MTWLANLSQNPFYEFAIILSLAALLGALGQILKQPLIVMFIALGIVVGPSVLNVAQSKENIHLLAEVGIAILLFIVGLKLDLRLIKSTGKIALMTGLGQVIFTSVIGYFLGISLGFSTLHSFYIAVALTFSSTIIIVKLLSDKKEIDALHGQIAIGFLIVQDIVVILVMIVLSTIGRGGEDAMMVLEIGKTLLYSFVLVGATVLAMRYIIPKLSFFLAKSVEMLTLFAIAWAVLLAMISELIGFSAEVGAFLAGVSLASSPFKEVISGRMTSLRDFLLLFFFVNLGAGLNLGVIGTQVPAAFVFSIFVLIGNPIIVLIIMGSMGYRKRTSFLAGLTVAQISEFSLIFAGLGYTVGHLTEEIVGLITLVGLITIALSTYMILYSGMLYQFLAPVLKVFEKSDPYRESQMKQLESSHFEVLILGLGRFGQKVADQVQEKGHAEYLGIDFDPQVVKSWQEARKKIMYGDLEDPDLLEHLSLDHTKCVICTVPDYHHSIKLVNALDKSNFKGQIFLTAMHENESKYFDHLLNVKVLLPFEMAAQNFYNAHLSPILNSDSQNTEK